MDYAVAPVSREATADLAAELGSALKSLKEMVRSELHQRFSCLSVCLQQDHSLLPWITPLFIGGTGFEHWL